VDVWAHALVQLDIIILNTTMVLHMVMIWKVALHVDSHQAMLSGILIQAPHIARGAAPMGSSRTQILLALPFLEGMFGYIIVEYTVPLVLIAVASISGRLLVVSGILSAMSQIYAQ
jgi:hypothetical protein